jgi:hypothetical protein
VLYVVQLGGISGYCISAGSAGIRCTAHGLPNLLVLVFEYCDRLVTHCNCSVSHDLHCRLLGDVNTEPLTVPDGCICVSYSVVENSNCVCLIASFFTLF